MWHFQITLKEVIWPPKKFKLHAWVKKCHIGNSLERAGIAVPCYSSRQKIRFVLGADEYLERLEGKIRKWFFFYVKLF